ncbi:NUDIX domain-containing protein [Patescibacteria group bacterium]|nr:NUDIX domain-containing protein [Patescibacteria group bacterium]
MANKRVFTQTYGVVGAIIEKDGKFLLVRENMPEYPEAHNKWNQPAGWVEVGEEPIAACEREVKEETGLEFKATGLLGVYSLHKDNIAEYVGQPGSHAIKLIFRGEFSGELEEPGLDEEISERRWFSPEEIYTMEFDQLRDMDIKQEVKDYLAGKDYPLELVRHTVVK